MSCRQADVRWIVRLCLLVLTSLPLAPGIDFSPWEGLVFRNFGPEHGLPDADMRSLAQDSRGFIWMGHTDGLTRFDGERFLTMRSDPQAAISLPDNVVSCLVDDGGDRLWIGTGNGLACWDGLHERLQVVDLPGGPAGVFSLLNDGQDLLVGALGGLYRRQVDGRFVSQALPLPAVETRVRITALARAADGRAWVGTMHHGLFRQEADGWRAVPITAAVKCLAADPDGGMWVGTEAGLFGLDAIGQQRRHLRLEDGSLPAAIVDALLIDSRGHLWVGTDGGGVAIIDRASQRQLTVLRHQAGNGGSLASNVIRRIVEDRSGGIWVACFPSGVSYLPRLDPPIRSIRPADGGLADGMIWAFDADDQGRLWVGTDNAGLQCRLADGRWRGWPFGRADATAVPAKAVLCLGRDAENALWLGTWNGGVARYDEATDRFRHHVADPGDPAALQSPHVWRIHRDPQGTLWFATLRGGLARFDAQSGRFISERPNDADPQSLPDDEVWALLDDDAGGLWVGTGRGLARRHADGRYTVYPVGDGGLSHHYVTDLLADTTGGLWVATLGGGINRLSLSTGAWRAWRLADGLPSDGVVSLECDDQGRIWMGTLNGLACLDPASDTIRCFGIRDGVQGRQFNRGSSLHGDQGILYFGGTDGFSLIEPARLDGQAAIGRLLITEMRIDQEPVRSQVDGGTVPVAVPNLDRITVPAGVSGFDLRFAVHDYADADRGHYRYHLVGFEERWQEAGAERRAAYTNLDPGSYRFEVAYRKPGQQAWTASTGLTIVIAAPWWHWWPVQVGMGLTAMLVLLGVGWGIAQLRLQHRLRALHQEQALTRERQAAAAALVQSENDLHITLQAIGDAVIACDRNGHVMRLNPVAEQLTGWQASTAIGQPVAEVLTLLNPENRQPCSVLADDRADDPIDLVLVARDGTECQVTETMAPILDQEGRRHGSVIVLRDVSRRVELEARLRQTQKMDALGQLAGGVAHDFNNMLAAIIGGCDVLDAQATGGERVAKCIATMREAGLRAADLTRQLLVFSRRGELAYEAVPVEPMVEAAIEILRRSIDRRIEIVTEIDDELPAISGDASLLQSALLNLAINARDAMPDGGTITVRAQAMQLTAADCVDDLAHMRPGRHVRITVGDTGGGIPQGIRSRIFEPFFTTKEVNKGTGLGLAAVYGTVTDHGGAITFASTLGEGTTFAILLPAMGDRAVVQRGQTAVVEDDGVRHAILVVDDEETVRMITASMLERLGHQVAVAASGEEAVARLRQQPEAFDCVILDIVMPGQGGKVTFEQIQAIHPGLPVVLTSGFDRDDAMDSLMAQGAQAFLHKPARLAELDAAIRAVLQPG